MTMYATSTMTSPVNKTSKTSKWLRLKSIHPPPKYLFRIGIRIWAAKN